MHPAPFASTDVRPKSSCFAVKVRTRGEATVGNMLRQKGFDVLAPTTADKSKSQDRTPRLPASLFPGYIFVRFEMRDMLALVMTAGVNYVVRSGKWLEPLSSNEEMAVQTLCEHPSGVTACSTFVTGQRVAIESGPFLGLEGTLARVGQHDRLVISLNSIFSSVSVDLKDTVVRIC